MAIGVGLDCRNTTMSSTDTLPQLLTIDQLAERLGVSIRHIRRLIAELDGLRMGALGDGQGDAAVSEVMKSAVHT